MFKAEFKLPLGKASLPHAQSLLSKIQSPKSGQAKLVSSALSKAVPRVEVEKLISREIISKPDVAKEIISATGAKATFGPRHVRNLEEAVERSMHYHSLGLTSGKVRMIHHFPFPLEKPTVKHDAVVFDLKTTPQEETVLLRLRGARPTRGAAYLSASVFGDTMRINTIQHNINELGKLVSTKEEMQAAEKSRGSWAEHLLFSAITYAKQNGIKTVQIVPLVHQMQNVEPNVSVRALKEIYEKLPERLGFKSRSVTTSPKAVPSFYSKVWKVRRVWEMDVDKAYEQFGLDKIIS